MGKIVGDAMCSAGCCIGIGLLSGKELQLFCGDALGAIVFAAVFFVCNVALRETSRAAHCTTADQLCLAVFPRGGASALVAFGSFVCLVCSLAGVQQLLQSVVNTSLPIFSLSAACIAAILCKSGLKMLKAVNMLSVLAACMMIALLLCKKGAGSSLAVLPHRAVTYALFSATASVGVTARLGSQCTKRENILCSALSAAIVAIVIVLIGRLCGNAELPVLCGVEGALRTFCVCVMCFAALSGIAANAIPVTEFVAPVLGDQMLSQLLVFGLAVVFSVFGLDIAMRIGYTAVALLGAVLLAAATKKLVDGRRAMKV